MARTRATVGPKQRKSAGRKGWPSKTRSYPWRSGSGRPAEGLRGLTSTVTRAAAVHRFTRWTPEYITKLYDVGGGVPGATVTGGLANTPVNVGTVLSDAATGGTGPAAYQYGGSMEFTLGDLPSPSDFYNLFDRYEIEQVDVEINCLQNSSNTGNILPMPVLTYVPDFDDSTVPVSENEIAQYQRAKTWTFRGDGKPLKFSIKPRVSVPIYAGLVTSGYAPGAPTMLSVGNSNVPHYGLKFWIRGTQFIAANAGFTPISIKMKYHLKFQDPK